MLKKILRFLGLCDPSVLPPQLGEAIDLNTFQHMVGGAVAIVDRKRGTIKIAIRIRYGIVFEDGSCYPDSGVDYKMYGMPGGWQAYTIEPFESFEPMLKEDEENA